MEAPNTPISARCPIRTALELLGGKWRLLILYQLSAGPRRFSELKRQIPDISEKMLAQELLILADNLLIERRESEGMPPRTEYHLSDKGRAALPLIGAMRDFAAAYAGE